MFLVFAGDYYYPSGGWNDFKGAFSTMAEADDFTKTLRCDWYHIVLGDEVVHRWKK